MRFDDGLQLSEESIRSSCRKLFSKMSMTGYIPARNSQWQVPATRRKTLVSRCRSEANVRKAASANAHGPPPGYPPVTRVPAVRKSSSCQELQQQNGGYRQVVRDEHNQCVLYSKDMINVYARLAAVLPDGHTNNQMRPRSVCDTGIKNQSEGPERTRNDASCDQSIPNGFGHSRNCDALNRRISNPQRPPVPPGDSRPTKPCFAGDLPVLGTDGSKQHTTCVDVHANNGIFDKAFDVRLKGQLLYRDDLTFRHRNNVPSSKNLNLDLKTGSNKNFSQNVETQRHLKSTRPADNSPRRPQATAVVPERQASNTTVHVSRNFVSYDGNKSPEPLQKQNEGIDLFNVSDKVFVKISERHALISGPDTGTYLGRGAATGHRTWGRDTTIGVWEPP